MEVYTKTNLFTNAFILRSSAKRKEANHRAMKEFIVCIIVAAFGYLGPQYVIWPLVGGVHIRPIPYQITKAGDVILNSSLMNDLVINVTVPGSVLLFTTIWVPLGIISLLIFFNKVTRVHRSFAGPNCFLFAIGISEFTTQILKMYVGRLRPNFYALCSFDVVALQCTADIGHQYEARQSFPSGHSSLSFCGMGVLMWFLLGYWIRICSNGGNNSNGNRDDVSRGRSALNHNHAKKGVFVALSPLAYSTFVAISRIVDNWHFPSDVLAGTIIGFSCATISYHLWFHPVFSDKVGCPIYHVPVPAAKDDDEEGISLTNHAV